MSLQEDIFKEIKNMDEMEAKKIVAEIFSKLMKIGKSGYTKDDALDDIQQIYGAVNMRLITKYL